MRFKLMNMQRLKTKELIMTYWAAMNQKKTDPRMLFPGKKKSTLIRKYYWSERTQYTAIPRPGINRREKHRCIQGLGMTSNSPLVLPSPATSSSPFLYREPKEKSHQQKCAGWNDCWARGKQASSLRGWAVESKSEKWREGVSCFGNGGLYHYESHLTHSTCSTGEPFPKSAALLPPDSLCLGTPW